MSSPSTGSQAKPDTISRALAQTGKDAIKDFVNSYTLTSPMQPGPVIDPRLLIPPEPPSLDDGKPHVSQRLKDLNTGELLSSLKTDKPHIPHLPVCIIGAGVSGLYIAMMLDSLGIKYELIEGSGRTGGRLYTHNFPNTPKFPNKAGKYQYYVINIFDI